MRNATGRESIRMTDQAFDFWYAVNNTEILKLPDKKLETFGASDVHYHL